MSTQDSTTNSTSGTSQAAEQNASFQQFLRRKKKRFVYTLSTSSFNFTVHHHTPRSTQWMIH